MSPVIVDKDKKSAEIARAALKVFAQRGVAKAKMAEVATAAGVGKGTIYEYFSSKDELFEFAANQYFEEFNRELNDRVASLSDPREQLETLIRSALEAFEEGGEEGQVLFEIWAEGIRSGKNYFDVQSMYAQYRAIIGAIVEEGIERQVFRDSDGTLVASIIISALDGLMLQWVLDRDALDLRAAGDVLVDLLMKGIGHAQHEYHAKKRGKGQKNRQ